MLLVDQTCKGLGISLKGQNGCDDCMLERAGKCKTEMHLSDFVPP